MKYILAIDQGTTGTTAVLIDENLNIKAKVNKEFKEIFPNKSWVEHDYQDIWTSVENSVKEAIKKAKIDTKDIKSIGITNQRETVSIWNKDSAKTYYNFIVWQDRRTANFCDSLKNSYGDIIKEKTGLLLDPYFSATKIRWILNNIPEAKSAVLNKKAIAGTIDSYLVYRLSGNKIHVTDPSNASRTLLMNLKTLNWDDELCKLFDIPKEILPKIASSSEIYGYTKGLSFLPDGIAISGIAGDQQAALFGQACFEEGEAKATYGTGSFILMNTGSNLIYSKNKLLTTVAWKINNKVTYAIEGSAFIAGALIQWIRDELGFIEKSHEIEELASKSDNGGLCIIPSLTGLGAPYWRADVHGMIYGISRNTNRSNIARAALEAIALQNYDLLKAMQKDTDIELKNLKVDGGASENNILMQFQSDVLNVKLFRPEFVDTTALGAAMLSGLAVGLFKDLEEIKNKWKLNKEFSPNRSKYTLDTIELYKLCIRKILKN